MKGNKCNTSDLTPSHAYLPRVLEYASLGIPVLTTKTLGNVDLFGEDYPLFVETEQDIYQCYQRLSDPDFYDRMSRFVYKVGKEFIAENAVEKLWATLREANLACETVT